MATPVTSATPAPAITPVIDEVNKKQEDGMTEKKNETIYHNPVKEPDVTMRKIVGEVCSLGPGSAAVLLQIAYRSVGRGVAVHSGFTKNPIRRGRRTFAYIYVNTFGTPEERRLITDATHLAHSYVKGPDYDADDVDAQLWVAATIYWSLVLGYEQMYGKLDRARANIMYQESSVMATALNVPPEKWPKDREAFEEYWNKTLSELEVTDEARGVARDVLHPVKNLPWYFKPLFGVTGWLNRANTVEFLPEQMRDDFGLQSTKFSRATHDIFYKLNRVIYPLTIAPIRHSFKIYYMADFRHRVKRGIPL